MSDRQATSHAREVRKAFLIAHDAHAGQKEESTGDDYIHHVKRVVDMVNGDEAKAVAWLHDVLEDSTWTEFDLRVAGISALVVSAVIQLTRVPGQPYEQYIVDLLLSGNTIAQAVKCADLRDHLRPNCPATLRPRYEKALGALVKLQALSEVGE